MKYAYTHSPEETEQMIERLKQIGFHKFSVENHCHYMEYPENASETFDGVVVSVGYHYVNQDANGHPEPPEERVEVTLLFPTARPTFTSEYWWIFDKVNRHLQPWRLIETEDWRKKAWPKERAMLEKLRKGKSHGQFHGTTQA